MIVQSEKKALNDKVKRIRRENGEKGKDKKDREELKELTTYCNSIYSTYLNACLSVSGLYTSAGMPGQRAHSKSGRTRETPF